MSWKLLIMVVGLSLALAAQELPKSKVPLPSRSEIGAMGWPKFELWCLENVEGGAVGIDTMARHYRDLRDEATANEANHLSGPQALQLETTTKAVTRWLYARSYAAGAHKGGSIYSHLGPRLTAELADVKHQCVLDWTSTADSPTNQWPQSYAGMAKSPLRSFDGEDDRAFQVALKEEAGELQEACKQVRKLPPAARQTMQKFLLSVGASLHPNGR